MSYRINLTNGNLLTTIADGTINSTSTPLKLIGKNYSGYGEFFNTDLVHILENFRNSSPPSNPLPGQLWYNTDGNLNVWNGSKFTNLAAISSTTSKPGSPVTGNQWWDTINQQFYVYDPSYSSNGGWALIGPAASAGQGTSGTIVGTILDNSAATHVAVNVYVSSTLVGIFSKDSYTPDTAIGGFTTISPGLNLSSTLASAKLWGTADNADKLGTIAASSYVRNDVSPTFNVPVTITDSNGLIINTANLKLSGNTLQLQNTVNNADIVIRANTGGTYVNSIFIEGITSNVTVAANLIVTANVNAVTGVFSSNVHAGNVRLTSNVNAASGIFANLVSANNISTTTMTVLGTINSRNIVPTSANTYTLGNSTNWFSTVYATAMQANYADLAERFEADAEYMPGTVLAMGGSAEVTLENNDLSEDVFGVISTQAGFLLNGGAGSNLTHPPIAVSGRVPIRVIGKIKKGDRLVSAGNGLARAGKRSEITSFNVIGRSLENKDSDQESIITAIVKLNS
jgi:hypothetical protein